MRILREKINLNFICIVSHFLNFNTYSIHVLFSYPIVSFTSNFTTCNGIDNVLFLTSRSFINTVHLEIIMLSN